MGRADQSLFPCWGRGKVSHFHLSRVSGGMPRPQDPPRGLQMLRLPSNQPVLGYLSSGLHDAPWQLAPRGFLEWGGSSLSSMFTAAKGQVALVVYHSFISSASSFFPHSGITWAVFIFFILFFFSGQFLKAQYLGPSLGDSDVMRLGVRPGHQDLSVLSRWSPWVAKAEKHHPSWKLNFQGCEGITTIY